ncbi:MAG TPA: DUF2779 domain-containing protein [Steroidobacteraceae bacterium]
MRLSKSRLLSHLQCPKRLWLDVHRPEVGRYSARAQLRFETGHRVGEVARELYAQGREVAFDRDISIALSDSQGELFPAESPLAKVFFEAPFRHQDILIRADVLERSSSGTRLIEVKSAGRVKDEHLPDVAIQSWVISGSGVRLSDAAIAHVDMRFRYEGNGDYRGLLVEQPVASLVAPLVPRVATWASDAQRTLAGPEPRIRVGRHCHSPHECPFIGYCWPRTDYPLTVLPRSDKQLDEWIAKGYRDVRDIPEAEVAGETRLRIWRATLAGRAETGPGLREALRAIPFPRYYLDFETIDFAVPIWAGTHPRQAIPFQWSIHVETEPGVIEHLEFLDVTGEFPVVALAQRLIAALGSSGAIVSYSSYEYGCIERLAALVPSLALPLQALLPRIVDLLPLFRREYYHPAMQGSWSLKALLPAVVPGLRYERLGEVTDGESAQRAYLEATDPSTSMLRKAQIVRSLLDYCRFDTHAMVLLVGAFR